MERGWSKGLGGEEEERRKEGHLRQKEIGVTWQEPAEGVCAEDILSGAPGGSTGLPSSTDSACRLQTCTNKFLLFQVSRSTWDFATAALRNQHRDRHWARMVQTQHKNGNP